jgi:polyisoprenoid-binding protein YceI
MTTETKAAVSTWTIDNAHSLAEFSVKHMMIATVKGRFGSMEGTLHIDEARPERSWVEATIDVGSIDTREPNRDAHLKSDDFFNAERYPKITFRSTRVERVDDERWRVIGDLTIRDVTKEVALDTTFLGQVTDAWGKQRAAFEARTELNRREFGLKWNAPIETGGVVVGDRVKVELEISAVRAD